ncbi:hypothetical protein, partial [Actinoplanes octamycinicus]
MTEAELAGADLPGGGPLAEPGGAAETGLSLGLSGPASVTETVVFERPADLVPAAETILFTRPVEWEAAAGRYLDAAEQATEVAPRPPAPVRREVTPLTENFLFGTPAQHAQEPRSPIDGAAETLLFAGLARTLATELDEGTGTPEPDAGPAEALRHHSADLLRDVAAGFDSGSPDLDTATAVGHRSGDSIRDAAVIGLDSGDPLRDTAVIGL